MKRAFQLITILATFLIACDESGINNSFNLNDSAGTKLRKITQNHSQFSLYRYDDEGNIIKYEFYHGIQGQEKRTIYADYSNQNNRLSLVEQYVLYNNQFEKTRTEEYEYDDQGRLERIKYHTKSEIDNSWSHAIQEFHYNETDQLVETIVPESSMELYHYDRNGNVWKREDYPLFEVEYEGPLTTTFTFDNQKNPFYLHDTRVLLPLANGNAASMLNPNNVLGWETLSPITGEVVARSSIVYEYNLEGYPISALETVVSPLTDPQPNTETLFTEYEYVQ